MVTTSIIPYQFLLQSTKRFAAWGAVSLADSSSLMSHHGNPTPPQSQSEPEKEGLIRPYSGTTVVASHLLTPLFLVGIALRGLGRIPMI